MKILLKVGKSMTIAEDKIKNLLVHILGEHDGGVISALGQCRSE